EFQVYGSTLSINDRQHDAGWLLRLKINMGAK
ncbi:MAG: hypothetical protein ACI86X_001568, partial [Moritella sp.]